MALARTISTYARAHSVGIAGLGVGLGLLFLSLPRTGAAYVSVEAGSALFQLEQGQTLTSEQFDAFESDLKAALSYEVETADLNNQLSYLSLQHLLTGAKSQIARDKLLTIRTSIENALKNRPLDAYLWTRYTHVNYLFEGLSPHTLAALDRSFRYGSEEKQLFQFRITLSLLEWDRMPPALRRATHRQIEFGASHPKIWGHILADLPTDAGERLIGFLSNTEADIDNAREVEQTIRQEREGKS